MNIIRVGEKVIDRKKVASIIDDILEFRSQGLSQQDVADRLGIDRTFISRLEKMGEVRKGKRIAVIGFPVLNKVELVERLKQEGVDYVLLMTDQERWSYVEEKSGIELFNSIMDTIAKVRQYDVVIIIGSNYRIKVTAALLDKEVVGVEIGKSPIEGDRYVDPEQISQLIRTLSDKGQEEV